MELVLQQKQTLNLVMTTELRQAIELLQYSNYELHQFLQEKALENPLIELIEKNTDFSYEKKRSVGRSADDVPDPAEFVASDEQGMREKLIDQAKWLDMEQSEWNLLRYLILNLDENGYLPLSDAEIMEQLALNEMELKRGLQLLHQLEPAGVGARDLQECLLLQVERLYPEKALAKSVIENYLEQLADKKWQEITKALNISMTELKTAYTFIQTLNPRPCSNLSSSSVEYLHPDIIVEEDGEHFNIAFNDNYLPEIRFNNNYSNLITNKLPTYVQNQYKNYQWLKNSIEQRRTTILKIMHVILDRQLGFFRQGFTALQPLTLKDVASEINMHESTVSRATANKVIQTSKGSFDLRLLFSTKLNADSGSEASQTKVKLLLEELIKQEDKYKPLSDQKISDHFKEEKDITVSRRTVAKYREELNIPSSSRRKELKI
ncbi:RNA polymerase factor sigma-54 [Virgibacillus sp. W0181]|uniref:RNA polymerase factor sigma-54 n=1 Tax=Virgibacillus sp. W0181 TaxID=3391581 RepID=UPI003F47F0C7